MRISTLFPILALLVAGAAPVASAQGFGPPVGGDDARSISAVVGPGISRVAAVTSFSGRERWELALHNDAGPPLTGAKISVNSGRDLTDPSRFRFVGTLATFTPGPPTPSGPARSVACSVSLHQADCPPRPSVLALATGEFLFVSANFPPPGPPPPKPPPPPWLAPGVPKPMTPGYDSAVSERAFVGGTANVHVLITLRDAARYGNPTAGQIWVKIDGNAVPGSEAVTSSSGPVSACSGPPTPPPLFACFRTFYRGPLCTESDVGDGSANFFIDSPQLGVTYDIGLRQTVTPTCFKPPARPYIRIAAAQRSSCPGDPGCSITTTNRLTVPDPDLQGSVTYQADQTTEMQGTSGTTWEIDYLPCRGVQAVIGRTGRCLQAHQRCSRRYERQYHQYGFRCRSGRLTRYRKPQPTRPRFTGWRDPRGERHSQSILRFNSISGTRARA